MPRLTKHAPIQVGQKYSDDGYRMRVVAAPPGPWVYMRPDYGRSTQTIMTRRAWLRRWDRIA